MRQFLRDNGLSLALFALFTVSLAGQTLTGWRAYSEELNLHELPAIGLLAYLHSGHFISAVFENWESEFLQMGFYVWLTSFLYQKGSSESRKLDEHIPVDRDPRNSRHRANAPWPVRRGGLALSLYQYSLSWVFGLMVLGTFALHAMGGAREYSATQIEHGGHAVSAMQYLGTSQFWFESFQNWQSEFLSLAAMVVLSIFLRHRGSPESKAVDAPHGDTGA